MNINQIYELKEKMLSSVAEVDGYPEAYPDPDIEQIVAIIGLWYQEKVREKFE